MKNKIIIENKILRKTHVNWDVTLSLIKRMFLSNNNAYNVLQIFKIKDVCVITCFCVYQENSLMGDTYRSRGVTSSCDGIPRDTREECEEHSSKTFVLMSIFASYGRCLWDLADKVFLGNLSYP